MYNFDTVIPSAKVMRKMVTDRRQADVVQMLGEVYELFSKKNEYSVIYSVPQPFEKSVERMVCALRVSGYTVSVEEPYYEDRPCGGYIPARLTISCEGA